jgi:uncharacterized DUF497 family protein
VADFRWDNRKGRASIRVRGIPFDEAASVFLDPDRLEMADDAHSFDEPRQITMGWSNRGRLLVVVTSERDPESPRIISARRATKRERHVYGRRGRWP